MEMYKGNWKWKMELEVENAMENGSGERNGNRKWNGN